MNTEYYNVVILKYVIKVLGVKHMFNYSQQNQMKNSIKTLIASATFLTTFFVLYFTLSLVGVMFGLEYREVIGCAPWFFMYAMFGSVISGVFASEVHDDL